MRQPVLVIGAGIAGLACSIRLAARGIDVTLIERHALAGGKIHQASAGGRLIDAGPTVFTLRHVFEALYAEAGADFSSHLNLHPVQVLARHRWLDGSVLDLHQDIEQNVAAIASLAGSADADHYRAFAARTREVFNTLDADFMQSRHPTPWSVTRAALPGGVRRLSQIAPFETLWSHLSRRFDDPRLRQLFARYATYCGSSPFLAPATLMLIAHAERAGVWSIDGGMQALADSLLSLARGCDVDCRFGQGVERIHAQRGQVSGVTLEDGTSLPAGAIVFCGDVKALEHGLHGKSVQRASSTHSSAALSAITRSEVAVVSGFDLSLHNVFFSDDYPREFAELFEQQRVPHFPTVYVCAQDRTATTATEATANDGGPVQGRSVSAERLFSLINAPARQLDAHQIEQGQQALCAMLTAHGLQIDTRDTAAGESPNDFAARYPGSDGALYGRPTHGAFGAFRRPGARTPVAGLYLAGGTVHPGAGVPMAALSGRHAAESLMDDWQIAHSRHP